eukprot:m.9750 g.9750  ORF g.9750 m.9750 type:complete len:315 (-) comp7255_c0_seq1:163-1107(-)
MALSFVILLLSVAFCAADVETRNDFAQQYPQCTKVYIVTPKGELTTQGNDLGMLPADGIDTSEFEINGVYQNNRVKNVKGSNRVGEPSDSDSANAWAKSQHSVTALTEDDATPIGFQRDTINHYLSVCVFVQNVQGRWLEVMATTVHEDQSLCVTDFGKVDLQENPTETACGMGDLYMCKDAGINIGAPTWNKRLDSIATSDVVGFRFYCKDSCEAVSHDFYWRIVASHHDPVGYKPGMSANQIPLQDGRPVQPDGENWCGVRNGDDYPNSLLEPYPAEYQLPAVFDVEEGSSAAAIVPSFLVFVAALLFCCLF